MRPHPTPLYIVRGETFRTLADAIFHARQIGERSIRITWER